MSDDTRPFPIQGGTRLDAAGNYVRNPDGTILRDAKSTIPWWLAREAYDYYASRYGTQQSLERIAERGGFGREELLSLLRKERP